MRSVRAGRGNNGAGISNRCDWCGNRCGISHRCDGCGGYGCGQTVVEEWVVSVRSEGGWCCNTADDDLGVSFTFVETVNVGETSGNTVSISRCRTSISPKTCKKSMLEIGYFTCLSGKLPGKSISVSPIRPKSTIISTVQVCWVGFRLSKSKSGKSENSDL